MSDRGTSVTVGYVLALAIATALVSGLLIAGGGFVSDRRADVVEQELTVIGQQVATNIEKADRLVTASDGSTTVNVNQTFPRDVTGTTYDLEVVEQSEPIVRLESSRPEVSVEVSIFNQTDVGASNASGGPISVRYDDSDDELVIDDV